jgi:hypothetical protein
MKFQVVLLGVLVCMAAQAAGKPSQGVPAINQSAPEAQQSLTGCVDEQNGQYVLLDDQMVKITGLQSTGSDREVFAKYVGRKVKVSGSKDSGQKDTFKVNKIEQISASCGPAK